MSALIQKQDTKSKSDIAYEALKEEIIKNRIPAGTLLVERQLCEALGASRTPVRSALQRLTAEGLVEFTPGRGASVARITERDLVEIYNIREMMEGLAANQSAALSRKTDIESLKHNIEEQERALEQEDYDCFVQLDLDFHSELIRIADNKRLTSIIANMEHFIQRITGLIKEDRSRMELSLERHQAIYEAVAGGNGKKAEEIMRAHIAESISFHIRQLR